MRFILPLFLILLVLSGCAGSPVWLEGLPSSELSTQKVTNGHLTSYMQFKHWMHEKPNPEILEEVVQRWKLDTNEVAFVTSLAPASSRVHLGMREDVMLISQDKPSAINRTRSANGTRTQYVFRWDGPAPSPSHDPFYVYVADGRVVTIQD